MLYREYGSTGKKISVLGFGGMRFKEVDDSDKCVEMMVEAGKAGVNYFDSAPAYFDGKSEERFGEGFAELKRLGIPFYSATKTFAADEKSIRKEIEAQLKRLKIDSIDFYHIWCITSLEQWSDRKKQGVIKTFQKLKDEGLIKHICISSHVAGDELKEILQEEALEGALFGYSAYNFAFREASFEAITKRNLGCVVMNPLGGGLIPENPDIFNFIKTQDDETVVEAGLRFIFAQDQITCAIVGFGELSHVKEAISAMEGFRDIPKEEIDRIKGNIKESFGDLCTGCQYCDGDCPEDIPISKLMDAYNHKKLYGKDRAILNRLNWHWTVPPDVAAKCVECGLCEEACTQHLPIIERLKEIARIGESAKSG